MSDLGQVINRSDVLIGWVRRMLRASGASESDFAGRVADIYVCRVPESARTVSLKVPSAKASVDDFYKVKATNAKLVSRWIRGDVHLPADAEEAMVSAMDLPWRDGCVFDLCSRHHVLPVLLHEETDIERLADLMSEVAEAIQGMAPILADGVIDQADAPFAEEAIHRLKRLASACAGLISRISSVTGVKSAAIVDIRRDSAHG